MKTNVKPLYFPKTEKSIRENFKGKLHVGLRKRLRKEAYCGWIGNCSDVGLTIWGSTSLAEVRNVHRTEMVEQGLADSQGNPLYEISMDEYGTPVAYLDQPAKSY